MPDFRLQLVSVLALFVAALPACESSALDLDEDEEPAEFTADASPELRQMIEDAPSDFTWDFFIREIVLSSDSEGWSGELQLCAVRIEEGAARESTCSAGVDTSAEALAGGVRSENLMPGSEWFPGSRWFPGSSWVPGSRWFPGSSWVAPEAQSVADAALSEGVPAPHQGMVAVYVRGTPEIDGVRPFGVILDPRE